MVGDFTFSSTPEIHFGTGSFKQLPSLIRRYGKNALILTGARSFSGSSFYNEMEKSLKEMDIVWHMVRISSEPATFLIDGIVNDQYKNDIDVVVSIGGGSVIDAGKAVAAMMMQDGLVIEFLEGVGTGRIHSGKKVPFIAVPTTAGTGSEATKNAVLSNVGNEGFKKSLRHDNFIPDIALVDPLLTVSCPVEVTAACGMDAFTQLLEGFVSRKASEMTDVLAFSGMRAAARSLAVACGTPDDLGARADMSYAALLSGIVLANAGLGLVHGFASSIGGLVDIPHGIVCGTLVGSVTRNNIYELLKTDPKNKTLIKYAEVGKLFTDKSGKDPIYYCKLLADQLEEWTLKLKIPKMEPYGVTHHKIQEIIRATGFKENPVQLDHQILTKILTDRI